jgi:phytoene dehydrogenase-like protein
VVVLEGSDAVGGRLRTDQHNGFRLDRGFAIHNTAYPEAARVLDHDALDLHPFTPGALVVHAGRRHQLVDPRRAPTSALGTARSPLLPWRDKLRLAAFSAMTAYGPVSRIKERPDRTTAQALRDAGISDLAVERFLRPFLTGVVLEPQLSTSARFFELVWRTLARGSLVVPGAGMQAIPTQLASRLPAGVLRLDARVESVTPGEVRLQSGERVLARAVVVATDPPTAARLLPGAVDAPVMNSVTTIYHALPEPPIREPILLLDADEPDLVANTTVISQCAPSYAPAGRALVETSVVGSRRDDPDLESAVRERIAILYDGTAADFEHLATYRIDDALPAMPVPLTLRRPVRLGDGMYVAGDHRDTSSIQGALVSGRRAATAVLTDLTGSRRT